MTRLRTSGLLLAAVATACGTDTSHPDAMSGAATIEAIRSEIFDQSCAFGSCHAGNTPAAKLDLNSAAVCSKLVLHTSCLFPNKMLVVPAKPEASFLLDKLRGTTLSSPPATSCAETNQPMPFGATPLSAGKLAQVEQWIAAGASCGSVVPMDAGIDAPPIDAAIGPPADVVAVTASASRIRAGDHTHITVTLAHGAPAGGQVVDVSVADPTILAAPGAIHVADTVSTVEFDVMGKRPAHPVTLTATSGTSSMSVAIGVTGLALAEILYDATSIDDGYEWVKLSNDTDVAIDLGAYSLGAGRTNYTYSMAQLAGMIPAHGCFIVGGPTSAASNGSPVYSQSYNFSPDLPNGSSTSGQASGYGLFDVPITKLVPASIPLDAVLCGLANPDGLVGPDGKPAATACSDVAAGHSVARTGATTWVEQAPTPNNCTPISL